MCNRIAHMALVVKDYHEAIQFYTQKLDFALIEDSYISPEKQWALVAPFGGKACSVLLVRAVDDAQLTRVGNQTGGRVVFFLFSDDLKKDYDKFVQRGVNFVRTAKKGTYGVVAVLENLYGNLWDLLEPNKTNKGLF